MTQSVVSIVIPTRNVADVLDALLGQLISDRLNLDIIVSDGGSSDATVDIAARHQARVTTAEGGRGPQLRAGVEQALGDWILLLHADSILPVEWDRAIKDFIAEPQNAERAACFRFALDDASPAARRLERMVAWRCRVLGLAYGDQGLLIAHPFLDQLGGVSDLPLMEDVALVRKIGRARLTLLDQTLVTSAEKFRRDGYLRRSARNLFCLCLYFCRVPMSIIRRCYG